MNATAGPWELSFPSGHTPAMLRDLRRNECPVRQPGFFRARGDHGCISRRCVSPTALSPRRQSSLAISLAPSSARSTGWPPRLAVCLSVSICLPACLPEFFARRLHVRVCCASAGCIGWARIRATLPRAVLTYSSSSPLSLLSAAVSIAATTVVVVVATAAGVVV